MNRTDLGSNSLSTARQSHAAVGDPGATYVGAQQQPGPLPTQRIARVVTRWPNGQVSETLPQILRDALHTDEGQEQAERMARSWAQTYPGDVVMVVFEGECSARQEDVSDTFPNKQA